MAIKVCVVRQAGHSQVETEEGADCKSDARRRVQRGWIRAEARARGERMAIELGTKR